MSDTKFVDSQSFMLGLLIRSSETIASILYSLTESTLDQHSDLTGWHSQCRR